MAFVLDNGDTNLVMQRDGPGRLYYRIGMKCAARYLLEASRCSFFLSAISRRQTTTTNSICAYLRPSPRSLARTPPLL